MVFWKNNVELVFQFIDKTLIDFHVQFSSLSFFVSSVYGAPTIGDRGKVWERLMRIGITRKESWCMLGDFNEILHNSENIGGSARSDASFIPFGDMIRVCEMLELSSTGNNFTWGGMRCKLWIQSKLDRCFRNKEWFKIFPVSNQCFIA